MKKREDTNNYNVATQKWVNDRILSCKKEVSCMIEKIKTKLEALIITVADHWKEFIDYKAAQEEKIKTQNLFVSSDAVIGESLEVKGSFEGKEITADSISLNNGIYFNTSFSEDKPVAFDGEKLRLVSEDEGKPITIFQEKTSAGIKIRMEYDYEGVWIRPYSNIEIKKLDKASLKEAKPEDGDFDEIDNHYVDVPSSDQEFAFQDGIKYTLLCPSTGLDLQVPDSFRFKALGRRFISVLIASGSGDSVSYSTKWEAPEDSEIKCIYFNMPGFNDEGHLSFESKEFTEGTKQNLVINFSTFQTDTPSIIEFELA